MKRKLGKRIISLLLTLAMVVGLMPGISLTVYAAPTEELLTTITATGKEQASYSVENVASVSFSYTTNGYSSYLNNGKANWGWWGYGWKATVAPAEGYTITKCVFYDDKDRTATDSEAPFVVETTEEDKTPQVNGTPILAYRSKGITKIEVYGYATPTATHSVTITPGDHMTKTAGSGDAEQTGLIGAMTDVVYTANEGYYFPENYSVTAVNGISVTWDSYTQITVSGTPTADAAIVLTAPTAKTTPDAPTTAAAVDCATTDNNDGKLTGVTTAMEYKKSDADSWTAGTGNDITGLVPGTYYVRVKATDTTNASDNQELTVNAAQTPTETLLTTITPTGKTTHSATVDGVVTVSHNNDYYHGTYGWLWMENADTLTASACEGYTITKCIFKQNAKNPVTDSSAPFELHFDSVGQWGGVQCRENFEFDGVTSIEVYGYATPTATHSVTITPGDNMTKTDASGATSQSDLSGAMTDVVYTANDGYYFPTDYGVATVNGISVTWDSYTQITVSGTPTADATITLTAPTAKTTPAAPTTAAATDCTTADNNDGKLTGVTAAMEYKKSDATDWTAGTGSDITGLVPGTYYVRVKATETTNASTNQELTIKGFISYTVTFKVVNGKWNEGEGDAATADKTVTLTGRDGDTLKLTANQIPAVGSKPNDTYKAGSWDVTPSADTEITGATTYTYTYAQKDSISQTVTFKVVNGSWNDETTTDKTVTLKGYEGDTLKLTADQIPAVGSKPNDTYKAGSWDTTPSADTAITAATTYTYTYAQKDAISQTVTFKVVNGSWNDETTTDKTVTLTGYEGDTLKLTADQIPAVGSKPNDTYKAGSWDTTPSADTEITGATTYTYTYAQKDSISQTVTFKVVNGSWNDETTTDKTVTLTGYEGDTLKLAADQIPTVGTKPNDTYKAGSWDVTPSADTEITGATTYTYTYAQKDSISQTVTFKVVNGSWNDETTTDKTVTLTGYEGDTLKLTADQIPTVGTKPADTYKAGSWDVTPDTSTAITSDTTFTYTYAEKETVTHTVTFKVQKGSWDDGTTEDKTVTVSGYEDEVLKLAADQIPEVGKKPDENCKAGAWDVVPDTEKEITDDITCTYSYVDKDAVTATVTFKVVDGSWNDGTTLDKTVTFSGYEGDVFTLAADQIPEAGANPADTFKEGSWDKVPEADTEIIGNVTYTYSYAKKDTISYKATFKVVNGTWNDGTSDDVVLTLSGYEGDTLKFASDQIPAAGTKPSKNYKAGSWDASFSSENELTKDTTYTYTYKEKDKISQTVTFRVVNGAWDDGTTADKIVTLNGYEGDTLALKSSDIPSVGTKPADSYKAGKWDIVPSSETEITEKVTYTYTYEKKEDGEEETKITYSNTAGAGSVWTLGSTGTLTFTFSRSENDSETIKHFAGAKVDGKELGSNDYSFKPGSVVIDLKADYLNKLSVGKHTLTAMFDDGDDVTVEFTIKEKTSEGEKKSDTTPDNKKADVTPGNKKTAKTDAPGTGDTVNIQLIFLVMVLSMCDIFALCNLRSKLDEKKRRR